MKIIIVSMETTSRARSGISKLETHLGFWLRRVSNAVSAEFARSLRAKETSVAEWVLIRELHDRGQATPSELAQVLGMTRGAVSKVVDKLEAKKWLTSEEAAGDNRVRELSLTREGRRAVPVLAAIADANDAHFFDCLSANEKQMLRKLLAKIATMNKIHDVPTA